MKAIIRNVSDFNARLHRVDHDTVVEESRVLFDHVFAADIDGEAACLYWTACVVFVAARMGVRLVVQAGTASFLRLPERLDDGVVDTHFSYVWRDEEWPDSRVVEALNKEWLPDMHVWAADPARGEIVDLTTKFLPQQSQQCTKQPWLADKPPDYLWRGARKLPRLWCYEPSERATHIAMALMRATVMPEIKAKVQ